MKEYQVFLVYVSKYVYFNSDNAKKVKIYEDKVTSEKHLSETTKPEGLSLEVIRDIEEKIFWIIRED